MISEQRLEIIKGLKIKNIKGVLENNKFVSSGSIQTIRLLDRKILTLMKINDVTPGNHIEVH